MPACDLTPVTLYYPPPPSPPPQVVAEPSYVKVMGELLFSHHGQELYLRNPASFNIPFGEGGAGGAGGREGGRGASSWLQWGLSMASGTRPPRWLEPYAMA